MGKKIEITIDPDGTVTGEAHGFEGDGCVAELRGLTAGFESKDLRRKKEFFVKSGGLRTGVKTGRGGVES